MIFLNNFKMIMYWQIVSSLYFALKKQINSSKHVYFYTFIIMSLLLSFNLLTIVFYLNPVFKIFGVYDILISTSFFSTKSLNSLSSYTINFLVPSLVFNSIIFYPIKVHKIKEYSKYRLAFLFYYFLSMFVFILRLIIYFIFKI